MKQHWKFLANSLELKAMPFYWRLSETAAGLADIPRRMPVRITIDDDRDYLKYEPSKEEWSCLDAAYKQDQNIGFLNPESGQLYTYGSSVNKFFHETVERFKPKAIYEIGCGAGFSIKYLEHHGWDVTGIDPSAYSRKWSDKTGFVLINDYFVADDLPEAPDFVFCNDVFEHVPEVETFSRTIFDALADNGVFCFCTTNSTTSITLGDISMLEHQHVNMFSERSIHEILLEAGFRQIEVKGGSYGNTFHVFAIKTDQGQVGELPQKNTQGYFERAEQCLTGFACFYEATDELHGYVPLRCIPYLAAVGDYSRTPLYDSNPQWRQKYIDGYEVPIHCLEDATYNPGAKMFVASNTFYKEIKASLLRRGWPEASVLGVSDLL